MKTTGMLQRALCGLLLAVVLAPPRLHAQQTAKPVLHGKHWVAITGKPLAATAGSMMFQKGGNAVDAACAMLAATTTMWDTLGWGGETQALIYDPRTRKVIGINALGVAPTGATVEFFQKKGMRYPPEYGPLAAVTPGTPGGLMVMLAEYGTLSLREVLGPALQMADEGYPIEAGGARDIERHKEKLKQWRYSREVLLTHLGEAREGPQPGEVFVQKDLAATLKKLVEAEQQALAQGKDRKQAIMAAYERFYRGDIAQELVRGVQEEGGLITIGRSGALEGSDRGAREDGLQGHRGLQADLVGAGPRAAAGAEHPGDAGLEGHGLQQREVHPHALPGDEPGVRGPGLLLRRPVLPAGRAPQGPALQGVREVAREAHQLGEERPEREAGRSLPVPG